MTDDAIVKYVTVKGSGTRYNGIQLYRHDGRAVACIRMYWRALPIVQKQIAVLLLGAIAPMLFNYACGSASTVDSTPFGFAVSGIAYTWGIFKLICFA